MKWKYARARKVKHHRRRFAHHHHHRHHCHAYGVSVRSIRCVFLPPDQIHFTSSSVKSFVGVLCERTSESSNSSHIPCSNRIYANNLIWKSFNGFFFFPTHTHTRRYFGRAHDDAAVAARIKVCFLYMHTNKTFVYYVNYDVLYSFV